MPVTIARRTAPRVPQPAPRTPFVLFPDSYGGRGASPVLRTGDLEIDTAARTVRRGGREIRLTPLEYALLEFLAFRRGRVVTPAMIREYLYGERGGGGPSVVAHYVRRLRQKIDRGPDHPIILTRWGHGYMLTSNGRKPAALGADDE